jgi:hypothetical protein
MTGFLDFVTVLLEPDRVRRTLSRSFLVRNCCGPRVPPIAGIAAGDIARKGWCVSVPNL